MISNMRKTFLLSLGLLIAISLMMVRPALAADALKPTFDLLPAISQVSNGKELQIVINGSNLKDLYAYEVKVQYDTDKLSFKSAASSLKGFSVKPIVEGGILTFASTKTGIAAGDNGNLPLCTLTFTVKTSGSAKLDLLHVEYVNSKLELTKNEKVVSRNFVVRSAEFTDIAGHWAVNQIKEGALLGFVEGYPDGSFMPDRQVTRAEFVTMLARALKWTSEETDIHFADAEQIPAWAKDSVAAAASRGVIDGYEDGTFRSSRAITRDEAAKMIVNALGIEVVDGASPTFADTASIPSWASTYVAAAAEAGIVKGRGGNLFAPRDFITRAETITLILTASKLQS
ncbi:S-layer homology domain-containing protein [Paenibacillus sp. strain BS8-2]